MNIEKSFFGGKKHGSIQVLEDEPQTSNDDSDLKLPIESEESKSIMDKKKRKANT